jgi:3-oxoacyl-ACP reductase-like protein
MFAAQSVTAPTPAAAPPATAAPATVPKPNYLPLIIVFAVLFLIAAGLVVYFLVHR